ncbi:CerR family C-terminal domain-containing protein [Ruficoccus amylovorans]|uniref:CerR family C-terminal domain-containing protein n=1 Tax=Ruficoccus amylovorans TaxID=1804625 RepID=A0A842HHS7_9BACT|nr:CerR family C-terminal domain-containing protein [Ruficoccus amylovorans]MBC2595097.1 CerR family C-terminal domain-containing protein [Ruficoccus amylovorans]
MSQHVKKACETRERLLKAAAETFAAHGYNRATLAVICQEAGANQAAANYHFGDKLGLYAEALRYAFAEAQREYPLPDMGEAPAEDRLRAYLATHCRRIFDTGAGSLFPRMFVKEMADPTEQLEYIFSEVIECERSALIDIVRELLGEQATEEDRALCRLSIIALFQFFNFSRAIREMAIRTKRHRPFNVDTVIEHTVRFALAGVREKQKEIRDRE